MDDKKSIDSQVRDMANNGDVTGAYHRTVGNNSNVSKETCSQIIDRCEQNGWRDASKTIQKIRDSKD